MASYLSEVPPDVIFSIFIHCDIAAVVSAGQTCRYLHNLALHKSVWLALVEDLRRRFLLPEILIPNLDEASTTDLIDLVKRMLTGPETWSPTSSGFTPEVSKRIPLHPTIRHKTGSLSQENEAQLSPSGRFVLFKNWRTLECWDVAADVLIWTHVPGFDRAELREFAMDEIIDRDTLIIMICETAYYSHRNLKNYIEILELNPRSGTQANLLQVRCPDTSYDNQFQVPEIRGFVAVVALSASGHMYLVLDWKSQIAFAVEASQTHDMRAYYMLMEIIPGHLILKTRDDLYLISVQAALLSHGAPVDLNAGAPFNPVTGPLEATMCINYLFTPAHYIGTDTAFGSSILAAMSMPSSAATIWFFSQAPRRRGVSELACLRGLGFIIKELPTLDTQNFLNGLEIVPCTKLCPPA
ncbi:hypothetical protein B0H16DRAFT_1898046 [Mycena metata]|uniref:F-box domain-containing protein n=1 Tax=Mycena metata TaxID=1033252 RepID=A0AAD7HCG9_9AGAR|nr:hypothetical protein B0H16DRAFT_1898046 [Mycena metata]